MAKAFFLDRDGTINVDYNYVHTPEEWTWCDGAIDALKWMNRNNYKVIVVTNQSGIIKGHYDKEHVDFLHNWVDRELAKHDAHIDGWYIAPHHPEFDEKPYDFPPEDRKPGTGMFDKAAERFEIDFSESYMAGDKVSDIKPAVALGMTGFFIRSRHEPSQDKEWLDQHNIKTFNNIGEVIQTFDPDFQTVYAH